jgi:hypothetical protein
MLGEHGAEQAEPLTPRVDGVPERAELGEGGSMNGRAGVWIDHRRAFLVFVTDQRISTAKVRSNAVPRTRLAGGSRSRTPYGPQEVASESKRDCHHKQQLDRFYDKVLALVGDADKIFIFGPGEAKTELKKRLLATKALAPRLLGVEAADKLTDPQIIARVKALYRVSKSAATSSE